MSEPRMRARAKGQQFPVSELESFLFAFGDDSWPLAETVKVLDEMATDYIIETCHEAAQVASYSRRQKIKVDDFKFVLRKDAPKLGRVIEYLTLDKKIKDQKRGFDADELEVHKAEAAREAKKKAAEKEGAGAGAASSASTAAAGPAAAPSALPPVDTLEEGEGREKERPKKKVKVAK